MIDKHLFHIIHLLYLNNEKMLKLHSEEKMLISNLLEMENLPEQFKGRLNHFLPFLDGQTAMRRELESFYNDYKELKKVTFGIIYNSKRQTSIYPSLIEEVAALTMVEPVKVVLFPISELDLENNIIKGTLIQNGEVQTEALTHIPGYIYNLAAHTKPASMRKIRALQKSPTIKIINPVNRFRQLHVLEMVASLSDSHKFLPKFDLCNMQNVNEFLGRCRTVFVQPDRTAGDSALIILNKIRDNQFEISVGSKRHICSKEKLFGALQNMTGQRTHYLVDGRDCCQYGNEPVIVRVYVQKNDQRRWSIVEMIAKTSSSFAFYNRGDIFDRATNNEGQLVGNQLADCALTTITYLDHFLPNLGSAYLDFFINSDGSPYLFYFGGVEQNGSYVYPLSKSEKGRKYVANILMQLLGSLDREGAVHVD